MGFTVTEIISQGIPVLLAEKKLAPNLPTVLFYLQIDGQPVDSAQWDQENPYIAVFKEKNKFGKALLSLTNNEYDILGIDESSNITKMVNSNSTPRLNVF